MPVAENLKKILDSITAICAEHQIKQPVKLIAVSKTFGADKVREAYAARQTVFGENKVQEGEEKAAALKDLAIEWHLIGHLQTNKVNKAVRVFSVIHSVDSLRLAEKISKAAAELNKTVRIFLQVNTSGEDSKSGYPYDFDLISAELSAIKKLSNLTINGLMTIGPLTEDPIAVRKSFIDLRDLRDRLQAAHRDVSLTELSMGMSSDYAVAIEVGATYVRIGSLIFGERDYSQH